MIGSVAKTPQCSESDFSAIVRGTTNYCSAETVLGVASVT